MKVGDYIVEVNGSAGEQYDDNINYAENKRLDDFITSFGGDMTLKREAKTWDLELKGGLKQEIFAEYGKNDNLEKTFDGELLWELDKKQRLTSSESFQNAEQQTTCEDISGSEGGRYEFYRNTFNLGYENDISKQVLFTTNYTNGYYEQLDGFGTNGFRSYLDGGRVMVSYMKSSETTFMVMTNGMYRYTGSGQDSKMVGQFVGIRQYLTQKIYIDLMGGVDVINAFNKKQYIEGNYSGMISGDVSRRTNLSVKLDKRYEETYYNQSISDLWSLNFNVRHELSKRLRCNFNSYFSSRQYDADPNNPDQYIGCRIGFP
ncbi:MAG TPA: hypothetical protein PKG81_07490, partial [Candidatus Omnitrophota bacterium]|nr:hypothetical protein [Candidatus Omnitrophota bacterium]